MTKDNAIDITAWAAAILTRIPENQQAAAKSLLEFYGPRLVHLGQQAAWEYLRSLMAGDLTVVAELDTALSDEMFVAKVADNTGRWRAVAGYSVACNDIRKEILVRTAPIIASILLALVGL